MQSCRLGRLELACGGDAVAGATHGDDMAKKKKNKKNRANAEAQFAAIPNQVFLGVPWKTIRAKYEKITERLRKKYPLAFVIVGRDDNQDADDLLEIIKKRILTSSFAIFDATGGNANVSLEFG